MKTQLYKCRLLDDLTFSDFCSSRSRADGEFFFSLFFGSYKDGKEEMGALNRFS